MAHPNAKIQALGLAGWLVATFVTGGIGAIASVRAAAFYGELSDDQKKKMDELRPDWRMRMPWAK